MNRLRLGAERPAVPNGDAEQRIRSGVPRVRTVHAGRRDADAGEHTEFAVSVAHDELRRPDLRARERPTGEAFNGSEIDPDHGAAEGSGSGIRIPWPGTQMRGTKATLHNGERPIHRKSEKR